MTSDHHDSRPTGADTTGAATTGSTRGPGTLWAGAAKADITPADLTELNPMGGSFRGVHDRIHVRALLLGDGQTQAALISVDLIEVGDMAPLRRRIEAELGIPFDHVIITATHSHNTPRLGLVSPGSLAHSGGPESAAFTAAVYDTIISTLKQARAASQPAQVGLGTGDADVNVNRDEYDPSTGRWGLGHNPEGPSDKTVWVVKFATPTGEPIAVLVNYAVHSTVALWTAEVSGDLAGAATRFVERELGGDVVALWTVGALGDQAPRVSLGTTTGDDERDRSFAYSAMDAQGLLVGAEVVRVARRITRMTSSARLRAEERVIACPLKKGVDVMPDMVQTDVDTVDLRLALIMLNDIALTGVSGEAVTTIYRRLRKESPLAATLMICLANDRIGYLPDDQAYPLNTFEVNGCPIVRGHAEDSIVNGLVDMIRDGLR